MFKLGIGHTQPQTATTSATKTDDNAKSAQAKSTPTAMPSSGLQIGSFAKARQKISAHMPGHKAAESAPRAASSSAFAKLGFDGPQLPPLPKKTTSGDNAHGTNDPQSTRATDTAEPVPDVSTGQRADQYAAAAGHNRKFESHLKGLGLEVVHNSGRSNNCAIYSLLDIAAPKLDSGQRHQAAREIRAAFDSKHPGEQNNMLLLDMGRGGHGADLVKLVNQKFGVDLQVGVVQAGYDDEHPVTQIGTLRSDDAGAKPPTHRGVVWDQHGHFESVREAMPQSTAPADTKTANTNASASTSAAKNEKAAPFAKLASIGKWRGPGASAKTTSAAKESFQLAPLDFKTETADWAKDTDKAVNEASKLKDTPDPGFVVPPRKRDIGQAYDRSKPGFTAIEAVGIRPFGNLFNATAAGIHGPANAALLGTGAGVGGIHDALLGTMNGHALAASLQKGKRYEKQLDSMLAKDIEKFQKDPKLDTLILTRDSKGKFVYDMDKVAKLASSEKPEHKEAAAHAKNVFLTAYIKDEVAGKRRNRATYELTRNVVGFASAGAVLGGTLGIAAAPASAAAIGAKSAGLSLGFTNALDVAKGVRGLKQRMRDDKEREIDDRFLTRRMDMQNVAYPSSTPREAIDGAQAALKANAKSEADQVLFRSLVTGKHIDETKSTDAKKARAEIAAKHAYAVVDYHVNEFAAEKEGNLQAFHRNLTAPGLSQRDKTKRLAASVKADPSLHSAYDLMRDVGMRRSEANVAIHALVRRKIDTEMAADPNRVGATTEAALKYDGKPEAGDVRDMRAVLRRH